MNAWPLTATGFAIAICVVVSVMALFVSERTAVRVVIAACIGAAVLAFAAGAGVLIGGDSGTQLLWSFPVLGPLAVGTTHLGALFACIAGLIYIPISIFTVRYVERYAHKYSVDRKSVV